jgi:hypothetical protein
MFGVRIHPIVAILVAVALVGVAMTICFASNPNFMPQFNPFGSSPFER